MKDAFIQIPGIKNKFKYLWMPPGWYPEGMSLASENRVLEREDFKKFEIKISTSLNYYVLLHFLAIIIISAVFLLGANLEGLIFLAEPIWQFTVVGFILPKVPYKDKQAFESI